MFKSMDGLDVTVVRQEPQHMTQEAVCDSLMFS